MLSRTLAPRTERDKLIVSQLWKCDQVARKISGYSGLDFEELRDVAREYLIKIYDSWNPSKANFSTWVNRCLNFHMMNYLRDHSRLVRIPRSYVELYLKIRKVQRKHPGYHELEIADALGVPVSKVQASLEAFSMRFSSAAEMCHSKFEQFEQLGDSEDLREIFGDKYKELLVDIANLPETDEQFLVDYLVKKRSAKTLMKNYPHINSAEDIKSYSNTLINNLLNPHK